MSIKLKKALLGRFFVRGVTITSCDGIANPEHRLYGKYTVEFYRKTWFPFTRRYDNQEFVCKNPSKLVARLRKFGGFTYISTYPVGDSYHIFLQYHFDYTIFNLSSNIITLAYLLYILYILLKDWR